MTPDTHFFDRLSETVNIEVHKEDSKKAERRLSESHQVLGMYAKLTDQCLIKH